jgi:glutaminase
MTVPSSETNGSAPPDLPAILAMICAEMSRHTDRGEPANYIPGLARADPGRFGIAVATASGETFAAGDADVRFSIQSVSKVFALALALGKVGDALWRRVGHEPSGTSFNSIVQLESDEGIPRNPFINAGAIVVDDILLAGHRPRETIGEIVRFIRDLADDDNIRVDEETARGEQATGFRNVALCAYMRSFGNIHNPIDHVVGVYVHQCAIAVSCRQLAAAGRFLMNGGRHPATGLSVVSPLRARRINALMMMCGHYDGSGDFAFRVGVPGKSGVGGGILAVVPGIASVAVWAPGLDARGNSKLGTVALEQLMLQTGWSVLNPSPDRIVQVG